jgi:peptide deformylase
MCSPVSIVNASIRTLALSMLRTMRRNQGIGLAAPQVGQTIRLFVVDLDYAETGKTAGGLVFINPELTLGLERETREEGCLSLPGTFPLVERTLTVHVSALNADGKPFELQAHGLMARCIQHEYDHLDGKVIFAD